MVASSLRPWFCYRMVSMQYYKIVALIYLLCVMELLDGSIHTLLEDSNLLILLVTQPLKIATCVVELA